MSVSVDTGGKSGRKGLNAELNLVPYIDLLTCMVAFLLITAVWTQLARLSAAQKGQGQAGEETPPEMQVKITVVVNQEGFNLVAGQDQIVFDTLIHTMDTALTARFADVSLVDSGAAGI